MNNFEKEFQALKPWDEVQCSKQIGLGYTFIITAGHGYLVVPKNDLFASIAENILAGGGFIGKLAYYLEEDCEATEFKDAIA